MLFLKNTVSGLEQQGALRLERDGKGEITGAVLATPHVSDVAALRLGAQQYLVRIDAPGSLVRRD